MHLLFNHKGKPIEEQYKYGCGVIFPDFKNGASLLGVAYKTLEDWLDALRKRLLPLGISDIQYKPRAKEKETDPLIIQFYFKKELDMLQFQAFAYGDTKKTHERTITSATASISEQRQRNIAGFAKENDITHTILKIDSCNFKVITNSRFDDLAIASHYANGSFDSGVQKLLPAPDVARVLTRH